MNIVGPRPERPTIFAELWARIPNYQMRQRARPGITGYAQVNLEYDASLDDVANKVKFDLEYLSRQSVAADLYIMAKTVPVMLFRGKMLARQMLRSAAPRLRGNVAARPDVVVDGGRVWSPDLRTIRSLASDGDTSDHARKIQPADR
jgi:hypothetical protein